MQRASGLVVLAMLGVGYACGPSPATSPVVPPPVATVPMPPPDETLPERAAWLNEQVERVSADRLMGDVEALAAIHTRHVNSPGVDEAAELIFARFEAAGGQLRIAYDPFPLTFDGKTSTQRNVVATLPGSDSAAGVVVVGAHYDSRTIDLADATSRAPGADDNATGVAALLEMARLLADTSPRATLVLVAFSAEEVGVVGSTHYVASAQERGDDLRAMLQLDIIGNAVGPSGAGAIRVFSAPPEDSDSRQLARYVAWQGETYVERLDVQVQPTVDRPGRYSDHVPFSDAGIPAVRFIEALEDAERQHSGDDTPETISPDYLRQATQVALVNAASLAYGPPPPPAPSRWPDRPDTLRWSAVDGAAGYAVAFRTVGNPQFAAVVRVGDVTSLTWDEIAAGRFVGVSVAAIGADGLTGPLSPELDLSP